MNIQKFLATSMVYLSLTASGTALAEPDKAGRAAGGPAGSAAVHPGNSKALPPGLQKKVASGKPLPPGWQARLARGEVLPEDVRDAGRRVDREEERKRGIEEGPEGTVTIDIDDRTVRIIEATREIVDIF
jgi:hypothetical protein